MGLDQLLKVWQRNALFSHVCLPVVLLTNKAARTQVLHLRVSLGEEVRRATWPACSPAHLWKTNLGQMPRATTFVGHFVHPGHKGTELREQKVGSGIQYIALDWLCPEGGAHQHCEPGVICPEESTFSNQYRGGHTGCPAKSFLGRGVCTFWRCPLCCPWSLVSHSSCCWGLGIQDENSLSPFISNPSLNIQLLLLARGWSWSNHRGTSDFVGKFDTFWFSSFMCTPETLASFLYLGMHGFGELMIGDYRTASVMLLYFQEETCLEIEPNWGAGSTLFFMSCIMSQELLHDWYTVESLFKKQKLTNKTVICLLESHITRKKL